jgi:glycosyltransferase involved in cell wall biosynthesis
MDKQKFFSIVIPTYNRADFIVSTLNSVFAQSHKNFEVIVVDDGSTDNTERLLQGITDPRLIYIKKENEERAAARNMGVCMAKGEYITFLDSDDLLYPNHFETAAAFIEENQDPEFFHLAYHVKDGKGKLLQKTVPFVGNMNDKIIFGNLLSCLGVFIRRDVALKYPFNQDRDLSGSEDWELWVRLSARYPLKYSNKVTSTMIHHESRSVVRTDKNKIIKRIDLAKKYLFEDEEVQLRYGKYKKRVSSELYTYLALHLAMTKQYPKDVIKYLALSFVEYPPVIMTKRFYAAIKSILI